MGIQLVLTFLRRISILSSAKKESNVTEAKSAIPEGIEYGLYRPWKALLK